MQIRTSPSNTSHEIAADQPPWKEWRKRLGPVGRFLQQQGALVALAVVTVFSLIRYENFDAITITSVLNFNAQFGLIALGMTFVIMTGGIDLSVGGVAALASVVAALTSPHGFYFSLVAAVLTGTVVGLINGFIVAWMKLQPFIATLAVLYIVRGLALKLINDQASINIDAKSDFTTVGGTAFGVGGGLPAIPFTIPLMIIAFLIGMYVLRYTRFGRYVLAIGGNGEAARLMGLPIRRTLMIVYTASGSLAGLAGVLLAVNLAGGSATEGKGWELIAIAAVVVGGTLLSGGVGSVSGTFIGVLLLGLIVEILQLENNYTLDHGGGLYLNPFWQDVIRGLFLLVVVVLQSSLQRRRAQEAT